MSIKNSLIKTLFSRCPHRRSGVFCTVWSDRRILPSKQNLKPGLRRYRDNHLQPLHRVRHSADGWGQPQVLAQPRGVRVRLPEPLPGHRQPLHVHPLHYWQQQEQLTCHRDERIIRATCRNFLLNLQVLE